MAVRRDTDREPKWFAHLFESLDGLCLFVRSLGEGAESHAQCVWHLETDQARVRKVRLYRLPANQAQNADNETRIVEFIRTIPVPQGCTPRYAELFSHRAESIHAGDPGKPAKWTRVSYWAHYNGGDLGRFKKTWMSEGIEIPLPIIARFIGQLCHTLWYLQSGPVAVFHHDLHTSNIFLHWQDDAKLPDFYIGDFGLAILSTEVDTGYISLDKQRVRDISHVLTHAFALLYRVKDGKINVSSDIHQVLSESGPLRVVVEELETFVQDSQIPGHYTTAGLTNVIELAKLAEQELLETCYINTRAFYEQSLANPKATTPRLSEGKHEALSCHPIPGPWRLARVDPMSNALLGVEQRVHHRPNQHNNDSDTDEDSLSSE